MAFAQTTVTDLAVAHTAAMTGAASSAAPSIPAQAGQPGGGINLAHPPGGPGVGTTEETKAASASATDGTGEDKEIPDQVKSVMKKLETGKIDLSLEDMNQARAALARLDLLLELEQKMHDLEKARAKREGGDDMASEVGAMLPSGVTKMPRGMQKASLAVPVTELASASAPRRTPSAVSPADYEVHKIVGAGGRYSADLDSAQDGKTINVRAGDKLADGTEVQLIDATTVQLKSPGDKNEHSLRIDNAGALSHGRGAP
ncbi:MAG: hypothetical protein WDO70_00475 [Alphaproteobacteria bacterium]